MSVEQKLRKFIESIKMLTSSEIDIILDQTIVKAFKKGTQLTKEGDIPIHCYMIVEGCVREYTLKNGTEKTTNFFTEGDKIVPYPAEGKDHPTKHNLVCSEDCIITISGQNFEDDLRKLIPRLDAIIVQVSMEQQGKEKEAWTTFMSSSPEERYQYLLESKPMLLTRVPQHQIASYLGVTPESLSRIRKRIHDKISG